MHKELSNLPAFLRPLAWDEFTIFFRSSLDFSTSFHSYPPLVDLSSWNAINLHFHTNHLRGIANIVLPHGQIHYVMVNLPLHRPVLHDGAPFYHYIHDKDKLFDIPISPATPPPASLFSCYPFPTRLEP